jgi:hypothetical protein
MPMLLVTDGTSAQVRSLDDKTTLVMTQPKPLPAELIQTTFGYLHNRSTPIVCGLTSLTANQCSCYFMWLGSWNYSSTVYPCPDTIPSAAISLSGQNDEIIMVGGN